MDKTKAGQDQGWEMGMAGVGGSSGRGVETTVLEQQQKKVWEKNPKLNQKQ